MAALFQVRNQRYNRRVSRVNAASRKKGGGTWREGHQGVVSGRRAVENGCEESEGEEEEEKGRTTPARSASFGRASDEVGDRKRSWEAIGGCVFLGSFGVV